MIVVYSALSFGIVEVQAGPTSTNYELKNYSFGSGGVTGAGSTNFSLFGTVGQTVGNAAGVNFAVGGGLIYTLQANVPGAPTVTNPSSYYNKLKVVIDNGANPSDGKFAIAVSSDGFVADTRYVQSDFTIGTVLGTEDWLTYAGWGGASGINVIGLLANTTYSFKTAARRGNFTDTAFSAVGSAATINATLAFDIDVAATDTESGSPYTVPFGNLTAGVVNTPTNRIWVDVDTNGTAGGVVYVSDSNAGLRSSVQSYTIGSASANLDAVNEGYGAIVASSTSLTAIAPYNGVSNTVGVVDATKRAIFDSTSSPVSAGRGSFYVKTKISAATPAASDYSDTLTLIAAASY